MFSRRENIRNCRCCRGKQLREEASPELEEVVIDQPRPQAPSPEPEPAKGGWLSLRGWFSESSKETEFAGESSV
ncbi:MAG: hypothetical protein OXF02_05665 [Simkaniaceae bacterium]|nr:hypothetical protein [Simkaniaceae bacterium]